MLGQPIDTPDAVTDDDPVDRVERELLECGHVVSVFVEVQKLTRLGNRGAKRGCCADNCSKHVRRFWCCAGKNILAIVLCVDDSEYNNVRSEVFNLGYLRDCPLVLRR